MTILPLCSSQSCALWRALATEPSLTTPVLGLLLERMSRDAPFQESRASLLSGSPSRVATLLPLVVSGGPLLTRGPLAGGPHGAGTLGAPPCEGPTGAGPQRRPFCCIPWKNYPGLAVFSAVKQL